MTTAIRLIDQQRRLVEVGRIRLGKKVPTQNGKSRPAKIDKFRLTSRDKARLDAAAALYGGTVEPWEGQWELYTDRDAIPIAVVPGQALSVHYELWGQKTIAGQKTPVICLRRCDGEDESKSDGPCLCAQESEISCKPTARLSVVLTEVPGLGVWRLESHGWNATAELQGTVELLEALVASGRPVRARLRLDKRESPHESGTRKFVVPTIDIDHTLGQVLDSLGAGAPMAIAAPASAELDAAPASFTPVPAELPAPALSIAEQVAQAQEPKPRSARAGAQQPMSPTGVQPRTAAEVSSVGGERPGQVLAGADPESPTPDDDEPESGGLPLPAQVAIWIKECEPEGLNTSASTEFRRHFLAAFSDGEYSSAKDVPARGDVVTNLRAIAVRVKRGELQVGELEGKWAFINPTFGWESPHPEGDGQTAVVSDEGTLELVDADWWKQQLAGVAGVGVTTLVKEARRIAPELGLEPPAGLDYMGDPRLVSALRTWLDERRAS